VPTADSRISAVHARSAAAVRRIAAGLIDNNQDLDVGIFTASTRAGRTQHTGCRTLKRDKSKTNFELT
jgi:hypothetical protein